MARGADKVIEALDRFGVEYVFGHPGGAAMPIFDALLNSEQIRFVLTRHEQGATHMADGYARATGKPGVVLVTSGPGATNTITGLLTALMDSAPIIALTGQTVTPMLGKDAFQEADVFGISMPVVKHSYLVRDPNDIPRVMTEAFHIATTGRQGPVLVDLPKDVTQGDPFPECTTDFPEKVYLPGYTWQTKPAPELLESAAALLRRSKRPLLYLGGGCIASGGHEAARAFAEKTRMPVTNTLLGKGAFPEQHALSVGMLGMHGTAYANKAVVGCDLIMSVGGRWDDRITGKLAEFCPDAKKIHIDIDPAEYGKVVMPDVFIEGDARQVLEELINYIEPIGHGSLAGPNRRVEGEIPAQVRQARRPQDADCHRPPVRTDRWPRRGDHRRRPAPDVGGPVLQDGAPPPVAIFRRRWHHGLWFSRGRRCPVWSPRRDCGRHLRRRRLPDDPVRTSHRRCPSAAD